MRKIATLFDRDHDGHHGVIPRLSADAARILAGPTDALYPTEKLDGTNVRVTVRAGTVVRLEKRRNPTKQQKAAGISEPWYVDASPDDPADQAIRTAAERTPFVPEVPDGEWSGEAIGPKIQGNPLDLEHPWVVLFSLPGLVPELDDARLRIWRIGRIGSIGSPLDADLRKLFDGLRDYLAEARSQLNPDKPIEGIVWHNAYGDHLKLKAKDYRR